MADTVGCGALSLCPVDLATARRFVGDHHRHNLPPVGWKFGVSLARPDDTLAAVGIAGRPIARNLDDGYSIEVLRVCTVGDHNAASMLYGALLRAAKALGYRTAYTYTLAAEPGNSLRAAGWTEDAELDARPSWSSPSRPRVQVDLFGDERRPPQAKVRWRRDLTARHETDQLRGRTEAAHTTKHLGQNPPAASMAYSPPIALSGSGWLSQETFAP